MVLEEMTLGLDLESGELARDRREERSGEELRFGAESIVWAGELEFGDARMKTKLTKASPAEG